MRALVLLAVLCLLAVGIYLAAGTEPTPPAVSKAPAAPANPPVPPAPPAGAFAGSASCRECHPDIFARWSKTAHALTIRDFAPDVVKKPFDGEVFVARDIDHHLGPGPWMRCRGPGGEEKRFPVEMVIGLRRIQMFTTRVEGRIQVLPVFLEVPKSRWFDYTDFIFGGPTDLDIPADSAYSWYGLHRNFSSRCGRCHTVDYDIGYDPDSGRFATKWAERAVACEACHGPAQTHVHLERHRLDGDDPIVNPVHLSPDRANMVCGQCHAESTMVKPGFRPGDDLFAFYDVAALEDTRHLYPDGRPRELIHAYVQVAESRCGPIACTKCHDPHGSGIPGDPYYRNDDDRTCTQCHADVSKDLTAHTRHAPESAGSRCVACHMPRLVIEGGHGRVFDHTISIPSMTNTDRWGTPNACRSCHLEQMPGWDYEQFAKMYPKAEERNHRVALAAAIGSAREGLEEARPLLLDLLRNGNAVYRAGAASYLAAFDVDLRPALRDEHPRVRQAAVEGVARRHPDALIPLLDDDDAVLRRAVAMALASRRVRKPFDWIGARPELRDRVTAVLEAFVQLRPDDADLHGTLERLYALAGREADAKRAAARYRLLRPWQK